MTSITLPIKKFPRQKQQILTFLGGRFLVTSLTLLITAPFTLLLYHHLSSDSLLSYNLLGLLPYFFGVISIARTRTFFKACLSKVLLIFVRGKEVISRIIKLNILISILNIFMGAYQFILYGKLSLFIISINSFTSIELALASIVLGLSTARRIIAYLSFVIASEVVFLFITLWGLWLFDLIFMVVSLLSLLSCLHHLDGYN